MTFHCHHLRDSALTSALLQAKKMHIYTTIAGPAWAMDLELHFQQEGPGRPPKAAGTSLTQTDVQGTATGPGCASSGEGLTP